MDETPSHPLDALVRDGVEEQRAKGIMPTPRAVADFIRPILEEGEKKTEANRLRIKPKKPEPQPTETVRRSSEEMEREVRRRMAAKGHEPLPGSWTETRKPAEMKPEKPTYAQFLSKKDAVAKARLRKRLRLLASKPDWAEKLRQVNPLALNGQLGFEKQQQAEAYIRTIIRDSCRVFGEWLSEPKKKLWFT